MTEPLVIERRFTVAVDVLFAHLTESDLLLKWWGPEGVTVPEGDLDFTRLGPWFSVMVNAEGTRFKVSGTVTEIDPPRQVALTWAWHDDDDMRGHESLVRFEVEADGTGSLLRLRQTDLASDESLEAHGSGWSSSITRLERLLA